MFSHLNFNPPAPEAVIAQHEQRLGTAFPASYRRFLLEADGAVGFAGEAGDSHYVHLYRLEEVDPTPTEPNYLEGLFLGSNGAGEGICLTTMNDKPVFGLLPFIVPLAVDFIPVAGSLSDFLLCPDWFAAKP